MVRKKIQLKSIYSHNLFINFTSGTKLKKITIKLIITATTPRITR